MLPISFNPVIWTLRFFRATSGFLLVLIWLLAISALVAWMTQSTLLRKERQISPPGKMYLVEGEWLHLDCRGPSDAPVWVLEAGAMGWSSVWEWFLKKGSLTHRVCAWDRAGMGWSRPSTRNPNAESSAELLHALLKQANVHRPFVLFGHSLGAVYSLSYVKKYPSDVAGLVLLDPAHPQQLWRLPKTASDRTLDQVETLTQSLPLFDFGSGRAFMAWRTESSLYRLPPDVVPSLIHIISQRRHLDRSVQEYRAWPYSAAYSRPTTLGSLPLLVISASDREGGNRKSNMAWWDLHQGLAALSSNGRWEVAPNTAHQSIIMKESSAKSIVKRVQIFERSVGLDRPK